jgi:hypothetical protein
MRPCPMGSSSSGRLCRGRVPRLVEAELDPTGRVMAVTRPQPWSLIGRVTSIPSAWRAATVAVTSSQSR